MRSGTQSVLIAGAKSPGIAMDAATVNEPDRLPYLSKLIALIQLYLEFDLSVTDAILAAECDLVTWKTIHNGSPSVRLNSRLENKKVLIYRYSG